MASVCNDPGGRKRIPLWTPTAAQPIRVGKISMKDAECIARHASPAPRAKAGSQAILTQPRLTEIGDTLHAFGGRGAEAGSSSIANRRRIHRRIPSRTRRPATLTVMEQAKVWLVRFVGTDKRLTK